MQKTRTFIVSGSASGIGQRMALALATRGERTVMLDIEGDALRRVVSEAGYVDATHVVTRVHDVRDATGWERVVQETVARFGTVDVMLNFAGTLRPGYVQDLDAGAIDQQIDVNVKGVIHATVAGARQMRAQGHGHIVNMASLAGISQVPGLSVYCASKHAVRGFSLSAALELRPCGIHVSVVCPDAVETPMLDMQKRYEEAAMTFGGGRGLSLEEIERALFDVLERRPLETVLPIPGSGRGALAKLANLFPSLAALGVERVRRRGRDVQARVRSPRA
jgi:short-subunit dehydrogenase